MATDARQSDHQRPSPPSIFWTLSEGRALFEFGAFLWLSPFMGCLRRGDGHPVVVLPGLMGSDLSTGPLRNTLGRLGYSAFGWGLGRNKSFSDELEARMIERIAELSDRHDSKVSLVGWSLGGTYAREVAKAIPGKVRCVITLGSPISHSRDYTATIARNRADRESRMPEDKLQERLRQLHVPPLVPTTSIFSKTDGIVAWRGAIQRECPSNTRTENVEVPSSHMGLGINPFSIYVIADRLAQEPENWQPFNVITAQT